MSNIDYNDDNVKTMVKNILAITTAKVIFTKKDGTERVMRCTLNSAMIPADKHPKADSSAKPRTDLVQAVYDLDASGWRSFAWDSVIEVSA
jgi:hypothetical protein